MPTDDDYILALLNSRCFWFQLVSLARLKRGGYLEAEAQYIAQLRLPNPPSKSEQKIISKLSASCTIIAQHCLDIQSTVCHRILKDLALSEHQKLSGKLQNFWTLDFVAFRSEVKKAFKTEIPVKDRDDWERYLAEKSAEVIKLTAEIETAEQEIDAIVYKLFDLTPEEIKLLGDSLEDQY